MSLFDQELVEFYQQRVFQQVQAARQSRQAQAPGSNLHHRLLLHAGDILISLRLKIKSLSRPTGDQEYTPFYT